ncbi:hypothetical protein ACFV3R_06645 [Streptomyces sp. NPDC059740]|uniref:hypothetical protein n=1 Tax=Streptomyces sp. NPDC059740 TaxID=3346926 RepID=UPI00364E7121
MNHTPIPSGPALLLIVVGSLLLLLGTGLRLLSDGAVWRALLLIGAVTQFAGWLLHTQQMRRQS